MSTQTTSRSQTVVFTSPRTPEPTRGEVTIEAWDQKTRMRRSLRGWGITWGMAIVAVLIPGLHFVLVPSLLIAGPIVAWWLYQQKNMILGGSGTCPACKQPFEVMRTPLRWPINDVCAKCHDAVIIAPPEQAG